jgi:hypothetical protein
VSDKLLEQGIEMIRRDGLPGMTRAEVEDLIRRVSGRDRWWRQWLRRTAFLLTCK